MARTATLKVLVRRGAAVAAVVLTTVAVATSVVPVTASARPTSPGSTAQTTAERSLADGIYSEEQAERGARLYRDVCSECHLPQEYEDYLRRWVGTSVSLLLETVRTTMPENNPGSLSRQEYLDVLTYIFSINGVPAGDKELAADEGELEAITIELPEDTGRR